MHEEVGFEGVVPRSEKEIQKQLFLTRIFHSKCHSRGREQKPSLSDRLRGFISAPGGW